MSELSHFKAVLKNKVFLTKDTCQLFFEAQNRDFNFQTGQFISIFIPGQEKPTFRAYSIASSETEFPKLELCIKIVEGGLASNYLAKLNVGDEISFKGPYGRFTLSANLNIPKIFIATGTGLAPIRAMIKDLFNKKCNEQITLLFGVRFQEDLFMLEENYDLEKQHSNFKFFSAVSRTECPIDGSCHGRVTDLIKANFETVDPKTEIYICGNKDMILDVRNDFQERGIPKEQIHFEQFY